LVQVRHTAHGSAQAFRLHLYNGSFLSWKSIVTSGSKITLRALTGRYLNVDKNDVQARHDREDESQLLIIKKAGSGGAINFGDRVYFRTPSGKYIGVDGDRVKVLGSKRRQSYAYVIEDFSGVGGAYTSDLPDDGPLGGREVTLKHLATCAEAVYNADTERNIMWEKRGWVPTNIQTEAWRTSTRVQAATFKHHDFPNVRIVAFRGTQTIKGLFQDVQAFGWGGPAYACAEAKQYFQSARRNASQSTKFYVTGHSLGGYLAESVASIEDIDGASFNDAGPVSSTSSTSVVGVHRPRFEVHLTTQDPLSMFFPGSQSLTHIAKPKWWPGRCHCECGPFFNLCGGFDDIAGEVHCKDVKDKSFFP
jgi:hypothetical protein